MEERNYLLQLSPLEYEELFTTIMKKLRERFPEGTVKKKNESNKSAHIPVQAYIKKLNDAAGGYYNWRISHEKPIIHEEERLLEMRGILTILNRSNEGQGFQNFNYVNGTKRIHNKDEVIKGAVRRALVNAIDLFEGGWEDLKEYREWGSIPFLSSPEDEANPGEQSDNPPCMVCGEKLTDEELAAIISADWTLYYCDTHIPGFVRKKIKGR